MSNNSSLNDISQGDSSSYVYLDYAAMAPLCEEALSAMLPLLSASKSAPVEAGMNPNSLHVPGRRAFALLEEARQTLASALHSPRPYALHFTSGATESDNAAIVGLARAAREKRRLHGNSQPLSVAVSAIEHDAVLNCADALESDGFKVVRLAVDRQGFIDESAYINFLESVENEVTGSKNNNVASALVSIQAANSEIGSIQNISKLCSCAHEHGALFHTDATQALGKTEVDLSMWDIDAATFSSHKIGGPRGCGVFYVKPNVAFKPSALGGGQEGGYRSGTQDVVSAVGFACAAKVATEVLSSEVARLMQLRDMLYEKLTAFSNISPSVNVEKESTRFLPNIVNVIFNGIENDTLVARYDALGFAVSGGSACSSKNSDVSHVLTSIGLTPDEALGELRVSFGRGSSKEDIDFFLQATPKVINWQSLAT